MQKLSDVVEKVEINGNFSRFVTNAFERNDFWFFDWVNLRFKIQFFGPFSAHI